MLAAPARELASLLPPWPLEPRDCELPLPATVMRMLPERCSSIRAGDASSVINDMVYSVYGKVATQGPPSSPVCGATAGTLRNLNGARHAALGQPEKTNDLQVSRKDRKIINLHSRSWLLRSWPRFCQQVFAAELLCGQEERKGSTQQRTF